MEEEMQLTALFCRMIVIFCCFVEMYRLFVSHVNLMD